MIYLYDRAGRFPSCRPRRHRCRGSLDDGRVTTRVELGLDFPLPFGIKLKLSSKGVLGHDQRWTVQIHHAQAAGCGG